MLVSSRSLRRINKFRVTGQCYEEWKGPENFDIEARLENCSETQFIASEDVMVSTVDEITINYTEDGVLVVKELDKILLSKGAWSTIVFKYQDWNRQKQEYGPVKFTIRRYQKREGEYRPKSKFNISSIDQANKLIEALQGWIKAEQD